mmetsp:Transcript_12095/g.28053  ORF Transcript_12095/g.28053 Transcript_12095/m.28053 type:complete len:96 (-) Transcript_12095:164-451(-)
MEELVPKPDAGSREALLEKRRAQTSYHRRGEVDASDGLVRTEAETMGGGNDWAARVMHRQQQQVRRAEAASSRVQELQAKEQQRMADFKIKMGLM